MKKLYFLDEEEKNRILNLHESATKRHYLGEQTKPTQAELDKREARWKTDLKCVPIVSGNDDYDTFSSASKILASRMKHLFHPIVLRLR